MVRGLAVGKFGDRVKSITWSRLTLADGGQTITLPVSAVADADGGALGAALSEARTPAEFARRVLAAAVPADDEGGEFV